MTRRSWRGPLLGGLVSLVGLGLVLVVGVLLVRTPSNQRDWAVDQERLPSIQLGEDEIRVLGLRDFRYEPDGAPRPAYRDQVFRAEDAQRVWFALAPFARRYRGLAHSFLTFQFAGDQYVAVSVEARREADESYSLVGGLLQAFEITYVVGTEEDLLGLRAQRGDQLYLYPSVASPEQTWAVFTDMMTRAAATQASPEFYHTLFNNCNTNVRDHVNRATGAHLPWGWGILLPGFSDALALEQGVLDTDLDLDAARERFRVDRRIRQVMEEGGGGFSRRIRVSASPDAPAGP